MERAKVPNASIHMLAQSVSSPSAQPRDSAGGVSFISFRISGTTKHGGLPQRIVPRKNGEGHDVGEEEAGQQGLHLLVSRERGLAGLDLGVGCAALVAKKADDHSSPQTNV